MTDVNVTVDPDHLQKLARPSQQVAAVAELIWNGLDADAEAVTVAFERNELDAIETITVADNGHGIESSLCPSAFGSLGGSRKAQSRFTQQQRRPLHGRNGEGRFRAFALGSRVEWITTADDTVRGRLKTRITSSIDQPDRFTIEESDSTNEDTGTIVRIRGQRNSVESISSPKARGRLTREFAPYLVRFPDVTVTYDGVRLDPANVIDRIKEFNLESPDDHPITLKVIEWTEDFPRELVLCDGNGFALDTIRPSIHAPQFSFSAYLSWEQFDRATVQLAELDEGFSSVVEAARDKLRSYFRERAKERTFQIVSSWKSDEVYPFKGEPSSKVEEVKRDLFDVVAVQALPGISTETQAKKLSLRLIRESLEHSPSSLKTVLREVLDLPAQQLDDLAALLDRSSFAALISAAQTVADRLDFLRSLELMLFDSQIKKDVLERSQLHRILAVEAWVFGEEYSLAVDDQSIKEVLRRHVSNLGRDVLNLEDVHLEDRKQGIVDLMLSRTIQDSARQHHLVVELKRPSKVIGFDERQQIESYALAVANDQRFHDTETKWDFILVANDITPNVKKLSNKRGQPPGLLHDDEELDLKIWVKSWGSIIEDRRRALHFYQRQLEIDPTRADALEFLRSKHAEFIPDVISTGDLEAS